MQAVPHIDKILFKYRLSKIIRETSITKGFLQGFIIEEEVYLLNSDIEMNMEKFAVFAAMWSLGQDGSLGIDPLVLNLMYDQISLNPLYLNLAEHHQDRIMDKVVKALSGPTIVYDKSDPKTLLIGSVIT
ncbi:hypothetical protein G7051_07930 [Dysgonomonas sp. HDW5B]|uniref:hypothetical protein n=1 Tax=Dysgonomonas sp. HDW5B TaxID=2714927 RepID=UPI001407A3F5|nr:hypothetical protein [Dysgonomonas sp. HDW5B]QIK54271.1 hypothetical protein G7051_07930 [Dysgonomonas sp. HDW5B]